MPNPVYVSMHFSNELNHDTEDKVCRFLSAKYDESFAALKIGDRLDTDHAKLFMKPENRDILFTAFLKREEGIVTDDYVRMSVADQVLSKLRTELKNKEIRNICRALLNCDEAGKERNPYISIDEFAKKYSLTGIYLKLIIEITDIDLDKQKEIVNEILKKCQSDFKIDFVTTIYYFENEQFEEILNKTTPMPSISDSWLENFKGAQKEVSVLS